ncbi:MAG: molybdenum cofactor biosynthesis protein [Promethearchaeia archaeon]|nr:MAG: molybdenum cofactor biosynthesis protein [Candidatus Lokiarchaeia archaeon]
MKEETKSTKNHHLSKLPLQIRAKVIMMSDSLTAVSEKKREKLDKSGKIAEQLIKNNEIEWVGMEYCSDDIDPLHELLESYIKEKIELIITIGGTGISQRDITIEAASPFIEKELPGFGELFRYQTYKSVGTVSIMTRALAGIHGKSVIVCLPGSPNAVELGINLILKEIQHIASLLQK